MDLPHDGDCWIDGHAKVRDNTIIHDQEKYTMIQLLIVV